MNICTFPIAGIKSFDSDVLRDDLPAAIGGWSKKSMIVQAAIVFAEPFFSTVEELASDEDIIALADLIDELGVECFARASTLNIDIHSLVHDHRSGVLDIDDFQSQLESGVISPEYLASSNMNRDQSPVYNDPGHFGVDFNHTIVRRLFCAGVVEALSAKSAQDMAESHLPDDRSNLDRWLA